MRELKNHSQISVPICLIFVVMIFGLIFSPSDAEAKISAGTYLTEIGSKKVCGDRLCSEPLSIAEKIAAFLESKREGSIDQQVGRFSEGGVSQQAFVDPSKLKTSGKYVNELLGFAINPGSFDTIDVIGETSGKGVVKFTTSKMNYKNSAPYFVVMTFQSEELIIPSSSSFKKEFLKEYADGLLLNGAISDVNIGKSKFSKFPNNSIIIFEGKIKSVVDSDSVQTSFLSQIIFLDGKTYSITLNSSPQDYKQSVKEFNKLLGSFDVIVDSMKQKSKGGSP